MPNCFNLTRKSEPEKGPVALAVIDEELCKLVGRPVHPTQYCMYWYSHIGFKLAMGSNWQQIRDELNLVEDEFNADYNKIVDYLETNFTVDAWAER